MRVLTVGNLYPPHHFGGYELVWASAVAHLRRGGHAVRVLAVDYRHPGQDDGDEPEVSRTLRWYWREHEFVTFTLRDRLAVERHNHAELDRQLAEFAPDVVSFWSMGGMSHALIETTRRRGVPVLGVVHDGWLDYGRGTDQWTRMFRSPGYRWLAAPVERLSGLPTTVAYGAAGRYVFVSESLRARMLAVGPPLRDTAVASSGIAPVFAPAPATPPWRWRLLHVGRLHPDKGVEEAVRALATLPEAATLTFAGSWDPREEAALARLVDGLGLGERVSFLGQVAPAAVAALYREADAVLFPVRWEEPWGLVPLEAMASGCPVLATGRGGSAEYLRDGENCLLAPVGDPAALAASVRRLATDADLRERLRAGGLATAAGHGEERFHQAIERHLREVAGLRATGARAGGSPATVVAP